MVNQKRKAVRDKKRLLTSADISVLKETFATKDDLKSNRKETVDLILEYIDNKNEDLYQRLSGKMNHLPTKEEFYSESAKLYKEVKDYREEQTILSEQVSRLADEMDELKN